MGERHLAFEITTTHKIEIATELTIEHAIELAIELPIELTIEIAITIPETRDSRQLTGRAKSEVWGCTSSRLRHLPTF